jgi:hypothetical protein
MLTCSTRWHYSCNYGNAPFLKTVVVISTPSLQAVLMDIHHNSSLRSILEDDSISSTSKTYIRSCLGKGVGLWLVAKLSICLFCIAHSIFTSTLCFHLNLIQFSNFCFLTCECGHELNTFGTHLTRCLFRGQQITTHDAI